MLCRFLGGLRDAFGVLEEHILGVVRQVEQEAEGVGDDHEAADLVHLAAERSDDFHAVAVSGHVAVQSHCDDVSERGIDLQGAHQNDVVNGGLERLEVVAGPAVVFGDHDSRESEPPRVGDHLLRGEAAVRAPLVGVYVEVEYGCHVWDPPLVQHWSRAPPTTLRISPVSS